MVLTTQTSSILSSIIQGKRGFVMINNGLISHYDYSKFYKNEIKKDEIDELVLFFHKQNDSLVRTYSLSDDNDDTESWLIIKGEIERSIEECKALSKLMRMVNVQPDDLLISSIIGLKFEDEVKEESFLLSKETLHKIDDFIEEFSKEYGLKNRQEIVKRIVDEFLKDPTRYLKAEIRKPKTIIWRPKKGNETIEVDILDGVATCTRCNSKDCSHVKRIYSDKDMITDLKRKKVKLNPKTFE